MQTLTRDDIFNQDELNEIAIIKNKIEEFLRSVKIPVELVKFIKPGILTGGMSASLFHGDAPKDWDIYLTDQNDIDSLNKIVKETESVLSNIEDINPKYGVDTRVEGK